MGAGQPKALVPGDLTQTRQNQIGLLNYLLGFGDAPGSPSPGGGRSPGGGLPDILRMFQGGPGAPGQSNAYLGGGDPLARLQSYFGNLGSPQSALQMQGADALGTMLRQPTPEQRALDISLPTLQSMLTGSGPQFEQDLSLANQQGGRFGSANAILRGEAYKNLYNLRNQTAGTLGLLSQGAGNANRGLAGQAFGVGQQQAGQADIETQRRLQLLMQLLGVGQQTALNVPIQQSPGLFSQIFGVAAPILGAVLGGPLGAAAGGAIGQSGGGGSSGGGYSPTSGPPTYNYGYQK